MEATRCERIESRSFIQRLKRYRRFLCTIAHVTFVSADDAQLINVCRTDSAHCAPSICISLMSAADVWRAGSRRWMHRDCFRRLFVDETYGADRTSPLRHLGRCCAVNATPVRSQSHRSRGSIEYSQSSWCACARVRRYERAARNPDATEKRQLTC
jgi:hypothetical protein